jgi:hypothetical protein
VYTSSVLFFNQHREPHLNWKMIHAPTFLSCPHLLVFCQFIGSAEDKKQKQTVHRYFTFRKKKITALFTGILLLERKKITALLS